MAKGFDKSINNKKKNLRRYAPLSREDNSVIYTIEKLTDCVYGEDFIIYERMRKIYATKKVIERLHYWLKQLENDSEQSVIEKLKLIIYLCEETNSIEEREFYMLCTEAALWNAYKLLHIGSEPTIEKNVFVYPEEEYSQLDDIMETVGTVLSFPDQFLKKIVFPFLAYLKKEGYFYHFYKYKLTSAI